MKTPISKHFNYEEFEFSQKAIELGIDNNIPSERIRYAIRLLVINLLEPLRGILQRPIIITSGYRCPVLNKKIGGVKNSQHLIGEAADLHCESTLEVLYLAQVILKHKLPFDQMIFYSSFLHLSFKTSGHQRKQIQYDKSYKKAQL